MIFSKFNILISYWKHDFRRNILLLFSSLLEVFGVLWLITEILSYFFSISDNFLKSHWYLFLFIGVFWGLQKSWPKLKIAHCLKNRDVSIDICISDIFKQKGSFIVGSNTTFETDSDSIISPDSIQGQFTKKYYDKIDHLDKDISDELKNEKFELLKDERKGKCKRYPFGTVVKIRSKNQTAYFLAISELNKHGNASSSFENLKTALSSLWEYIASRGEFEPLIIPILGSRFTRLHNKRDEIIREIIQSFVAANSAKKITDRLIIVIFPKDFCEYRLNLQKLNKYLEHLCEYTEFKSKQDFGVGQPVPEVLKQKTEVLPIFTPPTTDTLLRVMPRLLAEMKADFNNEGMGLVREFVVLSNRRVSFSSEKKRFIYYKEDHPDLQNKVDLLEQYGLVKDVTPGNTPIYRMKEEFVEWLLGTDLDVEKPPPN